MNLQSVLGLSEKKHNPEFVKRYDDLKSKVLEKGGIIQEDSLIFSFKDDKGASTEIYLKKGSHVNSPSHSPDKIYVETKTYSPKSGVFHLAEGTYSQEMETGFLGKKREVVVEEEMSWIVFADGSLHLPEELHVKVNKETGEVLENRKKLS